MSNGASADLEIGTTHFQLGGPEGQPPVVLICGFSVPYFIFDPTYEFLITAGHKVLRYDLLGRGWSARPRARYDIELFVRQLQELLRHVGFSTVRLVALSMGGPIAAAFAAEEPQRVERLALIDPSGAGEVSLPLLLRAAQAPLIGEMAMLALGQAGLLRAMAGDFTTPSVAAALLEKYRTQMRYHGFRAALISTIRAGMLGSFLPLYESVGRLRIPTMILWGTSIRQYLSVRACS
jgi:pimeloyl-ACP methyl ester carboxylesterase